MPDAGSRRRAGAPAGGADLARSCRSCCSAPSTGRTGSRARPPSCPTRSSPSSTWSPPCSRWAASSSRAGPPTATIPYGHGKIEFFSAAFEGGLIAFAAVLIIYEVAQSLIRGRRGPAARRGPRHRDRAPGLVNLALGLLPGPHRPAHALAHPGRRRPARALRLLDERGHRRRSRSSSALTGLAWLDPRGRRARGAQPHVDGLAPRAPRRRRPARRGGPGAAQSPARRSLDRRTWGRASSASTTCAPSAPGASTTWRRIWWCRSSGRWTGRTSCPRTSPRR